MTILFALDFLLSNSDDLGQIADVTWPVYAG